MKRSIVCFVTFLMVISMWGCGGGKAKGPSKSVLKEDLERTLSEEASFLTLDKYEITQSMTEDSSYTATIDATAKSKYAEFKLNAEVKYRKYDQGWGMEDCSWILNEYNVVSYPAQAEVEETIRKNYKDEDLKIANINMDINENEIYCKSHIDDLGDSMISLSCDIDMQMEYSVSNDRWEIKDTKEQNWSYVIADIEGEWMGNGTIDGIGETTVLDDFTKEMLEMFKNNTVYISNVTESGFDIYDPLFSDRTIHVGYTYCEFQSFPYVEFQSSDCSFTVTIRNDDIHINMLSEIEPKIYNYNLSKK